MNARKFDALTVAMTSSAHRASRRRVLRGLAILAAMGVVPSVAQAFDGGQVPVQPAVGGARCNSGADCAAGEICLNGACAPRELTGTGTTGQLVGEPTTSQTPAAGAAPGTTPVSAPETVPQTGVGGLIQPGQPLPARIYAGRCGTLSAEPAFQLIDVGAIEGTEPGETPQGALTAIPAEFSTTVVNAPLADLLASEHAIDVRVDDADPATSVACGDIGGPVEPGPEGDALAVGLQERGQSAYSGIGWLQSADERTVVHVFLARGLESEGAAAAQAAVAATVAPEAEPAAEAAQPAGTPVVGAAAPLGAGARVVTSIDVNLRAEPAEDAEVVTILGEGVELEVTGAPVDGWVPVIEPGTGQAGFVSDQFVTLVT